MAILHFPQTLAVFIAGAAGIGAGDRRFSGAATAAFRRGLRRRESVGVVRARAGDHYETLNLSKQATLKEIKTSYRNLARKYHPDMNKTLGAEEKFKEISAAYEVLSDSEKRSLYDRFGEEGLQGGYGGLDPRGVDPFEVFNELFGESNGPFGVGRDPGGMHFSTRSHSRGLDIRYDLPLSFEESVFGGRREISVLRSETCGTCHGTGAKSRDCIRTCTECEGRGAGMKTQRTPFGVVSQVSTCWKCNGSGEIVTDNCTTCDGDGRIKAERSIRIDIPAGVSDGSTIQVQGEGSFDKKRDAAGDLYLLIRVNEKPGIRRDGLNLYSDVTIDYTDAILGTIIKVETIEGQKDLQVPPGTQPGETIKFARLGVPNIKKPSVRGDHHFVVKVQIPKVISDLERSLVEKLASLKDFEDPSLSSQGASYNNVKNQNTQRKPSRVPHKGSKHSLWGSIKSIFGGNQTGSGFASISAPALIPAQSRCAAVGSRTMIYIYIVFLVLLSLIERTNHNFFLQQKPLAPLSKKKKRSIPCKDTKRAE